MIQLKFTIIKSVALSSLLHRGVEKRNIKFIYYLFLCESFVCCCYCSRRSEIFFFYRGKSTSATYLVFLHKKIKLKKNIDCVDVVVAMLTTVPIYFVAQREKSLAYTI